MKTAVIKNILKVHDEGGIVGFFKNNDCFGRVRSVGIEPGATKYYLKYTGEGEKKKKSKTLELTDEFCKGLFVCSHNNEKELFKIIYEWQKELDNDK